MGRHLSCVAWEGDGEEEIPDLPGMVQAINDLPQSSSRSARGDKTWAVGGGRWPARGERSSAQIRDRGEEPSKEMVQWGEEKVEKGGRSRRARSRQAPPPPCPRRGREGEKRRETERERERERGGRWENFVADIYTAAFVGAVGDSAAPTNRNTGGGWWVSRPYKSDPFVGAARITSRPCCSICRGGWSLISGLPNTSL